MWKITEYDPTAKTIFTTVGITYNRFEDDVKDAFLTNNEFLTGRMSEVKLEESLMNEWIN